MSKPNQPAMQVRERRYRRAFGFVEYKRQIYLPEVTIDWDKCAKPLTLSILQDASDDDYEEAKQLCEQDDPATVPVVEPPPITPQLVETLERRNENMAEYVKAELERLSNDAPEE